MGGEPEYSDSPGDIPRVLIGGEGSVVKTVGVGERQTDRDR